MHDTERLLFADLLGDADCTALLLDASGEHISGSYLDSSGVEAGGRIGAALSGMRGEVNRAIPHLEIGEWRALVIETPDSTVAISPGAGESLILVAASSQEPHGRVHRILARCADRSAQWLSGRAR